MGYPQVGTRHVLRICAILKSLRSVSSLPSESGAFVDLMMGFFSSGFPARGPGLVYLLVPTNIARVWQLGSHTFCGDLMFKKPHLGELRTDSSWGNSFAFVV